jgi:hypothetical protein
MRSEIILYFISNIAVLEVYDKDVNVAVIGAAVAASV